MYLSIPYQNKTKIIPLTKCYSIWYPAFRCS